jgi:CubicO group peptidase (beta-lactamase class C family)
MRVSGSIKIVHSMVFAICSIFLHVNCRVDPSPESQWLEYKSPEDAGWSSEDLENIRLEAEKIGSAAVMGVYKGNVVCAWGDIARRYKCHSVRKSLLSALIGIHVDQGHIWLDKTIAELGIDDISPLTEEEKKATVSDLLKARSGIYHPAAKETRGMVRNRLARGSHQPGQFFLYNNWDFNILGVIFEQETEKKIFEEFKEKIADPLGMEDYRIQDQFYQYERSKSRHPAYAFRMSARDLARFGWMFLQQGRWKGKQVIPARWVEESTKAHSFDRPGTGYGYMWWVYPKGGMSDPERYPVLDSYDKFAAIGNGGQLVLVIPGAGFVFVHRGDTDFSEGINGPPIWLLAEKILQARKNSPKTDPILVPLEPIPFVHPSPPLPERTEVAVSSDVLARYEGKYRLESGGILNLRNLGSVLEGRLIGEGEADFYPESQTKFFAKAVNIQLTFELDETGNPAYVIIDYMGQKMRGEKVLE